MNTTLESSGPSAVELERRLGSVMWKQAAPVFDLMAELLAEKEDQRIRSQHAGKVKASRTRRAIVAMAWRHRRQLRNWTPGKLEARALFVRSHIEGAIALSDDEQWMELRKPPAWRTVDKVLKSLGF